LKSLPNTVSTVSLTWREILLTNTG